MADTIIRFDICSDQCTEDCMTVMKESNVGLWVRFSDYERLELALRPLILRLCKMTAEGSDCECPPEGHFCGWPALIHELDVARAALNDEEKQ